MKALRIAVDMVLYFGFCFLAGTGIMMEFAFEKGAGPQSVLSFGKKAWETAHLWVGVAVIFAFIIHFCLNCRQFRNAVKTRAAYVALLLAGFGGAILLALWPTSRAEGGGNGQQAQIRARLGAPLGAPQMPADR